MAELVYLLCALTSTACAALLFKSYRAAPSRLLLFSCLCFAGLALNNILLVIDRFTGPSLDLELWRTSVATAAILLMLVGLIWEAP